MDERAAVPCFPLYQTNKGRPVRLRVFSGQECFSMNALEQGWGCSQCEKTTYIEVKQSTYGITNNRSGHAFQHLDIQLKQYNFPSLQCWLCCTSLLPIATLHDGEEEEEDDEQLLDANQ